MYILSSATLHMRGLLFHVLVPSYTCCFSFLLLPQAIVQAVTLLMARIRVRQLRRAWDAQPVNCCTVQLPRTYSCPAHTAAQDIQLPSTYTRPLQCRSKEIRGDFSAPWSSFQQRNNRNEHYESMYQYESTQVNVSLHTVVDISSPCG